MKAIVIERAGGTEALQVKELPELTPAPGEMIVDVAYAGVGYVDALLRRGAFEAFLPFPVVPGLEVSGFVRSLGEGVEGFRVGQPVASMTLTRLGGYASQARVLPALTVPLDEPGAELGLAEAAAAIVNLTTAYMVVSQVSGMKPGDNVLVHAAAGGLGGFIGQLARRAGAGKVLGTVGSEEKTKLAASLGYDGLFVRDRFAEEVTRAAGERAIDAVFDPVGGAVQQRSLELLRPLGRIIPLGNASGEESVHASNALWLNNVTVSGFNMGAYAEYAPEAVGQAAREALRLLAKREVHTEIYGIYGMENAAEAHRLLESGSTAGKLVLQIGEDKL